MEKLHDYEFTIIKDYNADKISDIKNSEFVICDKDKDKCVRALQKLGDYPSIARVKQIVECYQFTNPLDIKELLENGLNHENSACAFGTRLAAMFTVAYNYIGENLKDEKQVLLIWDAVDKANSALIDEFGKKLEPFYIDKLVSYSAEYDEAFLLARLGEINYSQAKMIVADDEREARTILNYENFDEHIRNVVRDEISNYIDEINDNNYYLIESVIDKLRIEFGIAYKGEVENDDFDDSFYDEIDSIENELTLPLYKTINNSKKPNIKSSNDIERNR